MFECFESLKRHFNRRLNKQKVISIHFSLNLWSFQPFLVTMSENESKMKKKFKCPLIPSITSMTTEDTSCQTSKCEDKPIETPIETSIDNCFVFCNANGNEFKISNKKIKTIAKKVFKDLDVADIQTNQLVPQIMDCKPNDTSKGFDGLDGLSTVPDIEDQNQNQMKANALKRGLYEPSMSVCEDSDSEPKHKKV